MLFAIQPRGPAPQGRRVHGGARLSGGEAVFENSSTRCRAGGAFLPSWRLKARPGRKASGTSSAKQEFPDSLSNLDYAVICEEMGRSPIGRSLQRSAPDTGNMETIARYGTPGQKERWLKLLEGAIRSVSR